MNIDDAPEDVLRRLVAGELTDDELADLQMPCPQGCGRISEDPYGGPCSACWELISTRRHPGAWDPVEDVPTGDLL